MQAAYLFAKELIVINGKKFEAENSNRSNYTNVLLKQFIKRRDGYTDEHLQSMEKKMKTNSMTVV